MEPTIDGGDDGIGVLLPDEGLRFLVMLGNEAVNGGLQIGDGAEHAVFEPPLCQLGEEAFDRVKPGARGGREVERPARVAGEPSPDFFMFMGGVVVGDGVDDFACGNLSFDRVQETDELLMPGGAACSVRSLGRRARSAPRTKWWWHCACNRG